MKKSFLTVLTIFVLAFGALRNAYALSITPGRTEVHLFPGQKVTTVLTVTNDHPDKLNIEVSKKNWFLYQANKDIPVDAWLRVHGKSQFSLEPGQSRKVPVTISCPPKAEGILVGMTSFKFQTGAGAMVTPMISVSIYLSVDGTQHPAGEIKKLGARLWQKTLNVGAEVISTGNVHLRPSGTFSVIDQKGALVAEFRLNESNPVYPGQSRSFTGIRQGEDVQLAAGSYVLKAHLTSGPLILDAEKKFQLFADGKIQMEGESTPS